MFINEQKIEEILKDTSYIRTSGSDSERECAEYIANLCRLMGLEPVIEPFPVRMYQEKKAVLTVDGKEIECKSWHGACTGKVSGELYVLEGDDEVSLSQCRGKIVLCIKNFKGMYNTLFQKGALGIITFDGYFYYDDRDIGTRILGTLKDEGNNLPAVNINIKDAYDIVKHNGKSAEIDVDITEYKGTSHNVILDFKGKTDKSVVVCAHYDTTSLSVGAFDNMSACITLLYMAEYFKEKTPERTLRLLWLGSEETGLVGSRSYCKYHRNDIESTVLNINLDLLGCVLGSFTCFSCADENMEQYLRQFALKRGFPATVRLAIRSSDSNSFVESGVPAVSFARYAVGDLGKAHTRYDTAESLSADVLLRDSKFITSFTENALFKSDEFPDTVTICEKIERDVSAYMIGKIDVL